MSIQIECHLCANVSKIGWLHLIQMIDRQDWCICSDQTWNLSIGSSAFYRCAIVSPWLQTAKDVDFVHLG